MIDRRALLRDGAALTAAGALAGVPMAHAMAFANGPVIGHIALEDDRVWMAVMIDRTGPYYFIVDTGAPVSLIDNTLAKSLRLKERGMSNLRGVGGVSNLPWYVAGEALLGNGIRLPNMTFAGTRAAKGMGKDAVGSLGAGLFTTFDSDLDFEKGEWRAYPGGRTTRDGYHRLKSRFVDDQGGHRIFADASLDGFDGEYLIDTGAPGEIALDGRASKNGGFWSNDRPYAPTQSRGIGQGTEAGRLVRLKRLEIGPFVYENPLVMLRKPGSISGLYRGQGVIGLASLGRLNLSTEVKTQSIWAAPNRLSPPRADYPKSGLWIEDHKGRLEISDVGTGSPGAAAGLQVGDVITGESLDPLLARLRAPVGSEVSFQIERGGQRRGVSFKLIDYLEAS